MIYLTQIIYINQGQEKVFHEFDTLQDFYNFKRDKTSKKFLHLKEQSIKSTIYFREQNYKRASSYILISA